MTYAIADVCIGHGGCASILPDVASLRRCPSCTYPPSLSPCYRIFLFFSCFVTSLATCFLSASQHQTFAPQGSYSHSHSGSVGSIGAPPGSSGSSGMPPPPSPFATYAAQLPPHGQQHGQHTSQHGQSQYAEYPYAQQGPAQSQSHGHGPPPPVPATHHQQSHHHQQQQQQQNHYPRPLPLPQAQPHPMYPSAAAAPPQSAPAATTADTWAQSPTVSLGYAHALPASAGALGGYGAASASFAHQPPPQLSESPTNDGGAPSHVDLGPVPEAGQDEMGDPRAAYVPKVSESAISSSFPHLDLSRFRKRSARGKWA